MNHPRPQSPWDNQYDMDPEPEGRGGCFWAGIFLAAVLALVLVLVVAFPDVAAGDIDWARFSYLIALLMVVSLGMGAAFRENAGRTMRHIAIWIAVGAGIAIFYSFKDELGLIKDRVVANVSPAEGYEQADGRAITFYAAQDGHYYIEAEVEGRSVLFLVDTGASDVVLTQEAARRLHIDPDTLDYSQIVNTANGTARAAPITLEGIGIGALYVRNVRASVSDGGLGISLLGMSFLNRLKGFEFGNEKLTLKY